jgi:hypothetical protein
MQELLLTLVSALRTALRPTVQKSAQESIVGFFQASAIGRLSATDSIHGDQQHDGDDHDHSNC